MACRLPLREVEIASGFFQIVMAQQDLDGVQVGAGFEQVSSEAMAEHVRIDTFLNPGAAGRLDASVVGCLSSMG